MFVKVDVMAVVPSHSKVASPAGPPRPPFVGPLVPVVLMVATSTLLEAQTLLPPKHGGPALPSQFVTSKV